MPGPRSCRRRLRSRWRFGGGGQPDVDLLAQIDKDFGSLDRLKGEVISKTPGSEMELLIYYYFR